LNRLEVSTAIDDFGIVPVRLEDLRRFPVGTCKIDHSLVNNLLADRVSRDVVDLILTLAVKLNKKVVAGSVETAAQYEHLRALGCKFGQGYFFSQPLKAAQADELIREQSLSARTMGQAGK
jgi:EAL domain-containing protein (putative c-di-GMP-specific phosphodiesterase class I)